MDLNDLCITLVLVNCVWLLVMRPARVWWMKSLAVLGLLGVAWWWKPESAGLIAVGPWALLIMLPSWLQHWTMHLMLQRHLGLASSTSWVLRVLHPTASVRALRPMIQILSLLYRGDISQGLQLAQEKGIFDTGLRNLALVLEAQMTGQWQLFEQKVNESSWSGLSDPSLLAGKVQAVAERGDWDELTRLCGIIAQTRFSAEQNAGLFLRVFAVLGDVSTVQDLLISRGPQLSRDNRNFWMAVAEQMQGQVESAQQRLKSMWPRSNPRLRPMIERQLATPAVGPPNEEIRDRALAELSEVRTVINHEARYAVLSGGPTRWPVMTIAIILVMLAVFHKEIPGGSEDTRNLEELGAMVVPLTGEPGEWKHMLTSGFLHFGPLHLLLNMLGLLFLGRLIERAWGPFWMLVLFLVCVVSSGALLPWLTFLEPGETAVFAGASGGIMGLLGGLWGHLLVGRSIRGTPLVRSQFRAACLFIVMQSACDLLTPQVSMTCHLIGLVTGMIGGVCMGRCGGRR